MKLQYLVLFITLMLTSFVGFSVIYVAIYDIFLESREKNTNRNHILLSFFGLFIGFLLILTVITVVVNVEQITF